MFEEKDDTIMARWLSGELSPEEHTTFEKSSEYEQYLQLIEGLDRFKKPHFDKEALREKVLKATEKQKTTKVVQLKPLFYVAGLAASLLLLFGIFFNEISYRSEVGEKMAVVLPDGSEVFLNANSEISHQRFFWEKNKIVKLSGEAFFNIQKGDDFVVATNTGNISVLGTQFNINSRTKDIAVYCYEGKVLYENPQESHKAYLNAGDAIQVRESVLLEFKHEEVKPSWQSGKSTFSNANLREVIKELQSQYNFTFKYDESMQLAHFTGTFVHDNLDLALKSVFIPMGITYKLDEIKKTVTLNVP